jgi:hypothetical protein
VLWEAISKSMSLNEQRDTEKSTANGQTLEALAGNDPG